MQKGKLVQKVQNIFGANSRVTKALKGYQKLQEVKEISHHFSTYLVPKIAHDEALKNESFKIRYQVYCTEEGFEPPNPLEIESDEFDAYSVCCLIEHVQNKRFAGTVRMVRPKSTVVIRLQIAHLILETSPAMRFVKFLDLQYQMSSVEDRWINSMVLQLVLSIQRVILKQSYVASLSLR